MIHSQDVSHLPLFFLTLSLKHPVLFLTNFLDFFSVIVLFVSVVQYASFNAIGVNTYGFMISSSKKMITYIDLMRRFLSHQLTSNRIFKETSELT